MFPWCYQIPNHLNTNSERLIIQLGPLFLRNIFTTFATAVRKMSTFILGCFCFYRRFICSQICCPCFLVFIITPWKHQKGRIFMQKMKVKQTGSTLCIMKKQQKYIYRKSKKKRKRFIFNFKLFSHFLCLHISFVYHFFCLSIPFC